MPIVLGNGTITGLAASGLPDGIITAGNMGYPGTPVGVSTIVSRTITTYTAPVSGNGTEMALLTLTHTPKKAGNIIVLDYMVNGECNSHDVVFVVTRNNVPLPDSTNSSGATGNRWSGVYAQFYDPDTSSTPDNIAFRFVDKSSLSTASTYRLHIRSSNGTARTFYVNRTVTSAGADSYEAGVSTLIITEYQV
jgi:hypothetical protein